MNGAPPFLSTRKIPVAVAIYLFIITYFNNIVNFITYTAGVVGYTETILLEGQPPKIYRGEPMKVIVLLTGPHQTVNRMGTKCRKSITYEWELPDISMGALTRLRQNLARHHTSGIANPLAVTQDGVGDDRAVMVRLTLKQPVLRGTVLMVNVAVKKALRDKGD